MKQYKNLLKLINSNTIPIIIYNNILDNYKIIKNNNNVNIQTKSFIKENKIIKDNINKKISNKYYKYIEIFINTLNNSLKHCNFDNLNNNIKDITIIENFSKIIGFLLYASYHVKDNKILLYNKNFSNNLNHELFHMASTKKVNNKLILTGFAIIDSKKRKKYGIFLDEGYTEYLNSKYFSTSDVYNTQKAFIKKIEDIIGSELMEQMYFNGDLKGLIYELMKYSNTLDNVLEFIINTDYIHKNLYTINLLKRIKLKKACESINAFLVKSYYAKIQNKNYNTKVKELTKYMNELVDIDIDFKSNYYYMNNIRDYYKKINQKQKKLVH